MRKLGDGRPNNLLRTKLATVLALVALPAGALAADRTVAPDPLSPRAQSRVPADFDVRDRTRGERPSATARRAQRRLLRGMRGRGNLQLDRRTGTPALLARADGFLTKRRGGKPAKIALDYLRGNAAAFGLDRDDISSLREKRRATARSGLTRIEWEQVHDGVPAFDNGVRANVSRGRLLNLTGGPEPDLSVPSTDPKLSSADAVEAALRSVGVRRQVRRRRTARDGSVFLSGRNQAKLVLFAGFGPTRLAWSTIARANREAVYRAVVDADTGGVLKRTNLVAKATVRAFDYTPIHPPGNTVADRGASTSGEDPWLTGSFDRLRGDNTWAYSDEHDNTNTCSGRPGCHLDPFAAQEIPPSTANGADSVWNYPQVTGTPAGSNCPPTGCTWDGAAPIAAPFAPGDNWQKNREQAGTQLFYFVNNFHDHLQNDPNIDFSDGWGNFEQTTTDPGELGGDPVEAQVDDGAATAASSDDFPNAAHLNNARMLTLPDGTGPEMSMFLFGDLDSNDPPSDPNDVNGADDAAIVYHEYTHGLSNRLVDPDGSGDLFTDEGGAMGEAFSDWYAIDYLNANGFEPDNPAAVDIFYGEYENLPFSFQGLDCTVGNTAECPEPPPTPAVAGAGGFTYGDFGKIRNGTEVHADGEIWAQTLWDLRRSLIAAHGTSVGIARARALVTDGMRLSPSNPTFLDMRNAIMQANESRGFTDCARLWTVFAARGMGVNAMTNGPEFNALTPINIDEDFTESTSCPPSTTGGGGTGGGTTGGGATGGGGTGGGTTGGGTTTPPLVPRRATFPRFPRSIRASRSGRFTIRFRSGAFAQEGTAALRSVNRVRTSARRRVTLVRRRFTVPGDGRVRMRIRLSRRNRRILALNRRYRVRLTVELRNASGRSTASRTFTLRAPRR